MTEPTGSLNPVVQDILEVALSEFANYGLAGTRIDAIVARTQTSKRMIYYHFGSKEGLYKAVLDYAYRMVREPRPFEVPAGTPPLDALAMLAGQAFDNFCKRPDFIRLSLQENLQGARFLRASPELAELNRLGVERVGQILAEGQADGTIRPGISAMDVYINFVGLAAYHISSRNSYDALFGYDFAQPEITRSRRTAVVDAIIRYARSDKPA